MYFLHSPLAWALLLVAAPLVIHLLNLLRQQRVDWAAMEFLLRSHRKRRHWIRLKQLLLLLLRMLAIALAVVMFARLVTRDSWNPFFSSQQTHYYLLVDDSFSMLDRRGASTAFDRGVSALRRLTTRLASQASNQRVSLTRFSQAAKSAVTTSANTDTNASLDLTAELLDAKDDSLMQQTWAQLSASDLSVTASHALDLATRLIEQRTSEKAVVIVVSDFRKKDWAQEPDTMTSLRRLERSEAEIHFIRCVDQRRPNLAVAALRRVTPQPVAGVPCVVEIDVMNYGQSSVQDVPLRLSMEQFGDAGDLDGIVTELAEQLVPPISPGEMVTIRSQVVLTEPGAHVVEARLPADTLETDNRRWIHIEAQPFVSVLVLAEGDALLDARHLITVFEPNETARTGIRATVEPPGVLNRMTDDVLHGYACIYLVDPPPLSDSALARLALFVERGGGLACFAGPRSDTEFWNTTRQFEGSGAPLFNLIARGIRPLPPRNDQDVPDLRPSHPIFRILQGSRNPWLPAVHIDNYLRVDLPDSRPVDWELAATTRDDAPLVLTRRAGAGRVLAFLTTLGPRWNNWARQPSFVVFLLGLQDYLVSRQMDTRDHTAGDRWRLTVDSDRYRASATLVAPGADPFTDHTTHACELTAAGQELELSMPYGRADQGSSIGTRRGPYMLQLIQNRGSTDLRHFTVNVDHREGELDVLNVAELQDSVAGLEIGIHGVDQQFGQMFTSRESSWSQTFLAVLIVILVVEQLLAYSTSYHPAARSSA